MSAIRTTPAIHVRAAFGDTTAETTLIIGSVAHAEELVARREAALTVERDKADATTASAMRRLQGLASGIEIAEGDADIRRASELDSCDRKTLRRLRPIELLLAWLVETRTAARLKVTVKHDAQRAAAEHKLHTISAATERIAPTVPSSADTGGGTGSSSKSAR